VGWLLTVAVVLGSLWWIRRAPASPGGLLPGVVERADATIFAVAAGCLVAAPIAWLNYTVMLWPGALVLLRAGRWRVAVPLLVFPVIPVAWGNLWQAAPTATVSLVGRSLYCAVLLGFWIALLEFARNYPASPFAAPVEGAGAAPATGSDPAGPEATVEAAAGSAAAGSAAAGSAAARSGTAGAAGAGSPRSQSTPLGGIRSDAEAGRPCQGSSVATTEPRFPTPEPP
jgi:arabinofuranan 3-O-arabinosyltransferase